MNSLFVTSLLTLISLNFVWAQEKSLECAKDEKIVEEAPAAKTCSIASKSNESLLKAVADACTKYADQMSQEEVENSVSKFAALLIPVPFEF